MKNENDKQNHEGCQASPVAPCSASDFIDRHYEGLVASYTFMDRANDRSANVSIWEDGHFEVVGNQSLINFFCDQIVEFRDLIKVSNDSLSDGTRIYLRVRNSNGDLTLVGHELSQDSAIPAIGDVGHQDHASNRDFEGSTDNADGPVWQHTVHKSV